MTQTRKKRLLWALCLAALALFAAAMVWLHYQQLCATGRGEDPYTSDLGQHLHFAQSGLIYSATSLLIGPAYAVGGKLGIALLLAVFHLAAVVVFAWGLKAALPEWSLPARLLASFVVNLAQAVYIPRGGEYAYQHGQVVQRAGLLLVRGREVHRNPRRWKHVTRVLNRRANALAGFLDRRVRKADDFKRGQPVRDIRLHQYGESADSVQAMALDAR